MAVLRSDRDGRAVATLSPAPTLPTDDLFRGAREVGSEDHGAAPPSEDSTAMARDQKIMICITACELAAIAAAAAAAGTTRAEWVRDQGLRAANCSPNHPAPLPAASHRHQPAKLTHTARTFFSDEQFAALDEYARACELTVSEFIRKVVLGYRPMARRSPTRSAIVAVDRAAKVLRELLHLADSGTHLAPDLIVSVRELLDEIHTLRDALLTADAAASREPAE
jgi:hypothetical protein